jgi:muramoyltetrapeptide carboxypeptidase
MTGLAALMASPALPALSGGAYAAPSTGKRIKPSRIKPGDTIGLIEPASASDDPFDLVLVEEAIREMGLVPKRAPNLLKRYGYLAGQDKERAADINAMFADKDVKAIFAVRGGWGAARALPFVDWDVMRANPKFLIGYSDITALHMAIAAKGGAVTLHGAQCQQCMG